MTTKKVPNCANMGKEVYTKMIISNFFESKLLKRFFHAPNIQVKIDIYRCYYFATLCYNVHHIWIYPKWNVMHRVLFTKCCQGAVVLVLWVHLSRLAQVFALLSLTRIWFYYLQQLLFQRPPRSNLFIIRNTLIQHWP